MFPSGYSCQSQYIAIRRTSGRVLPLVLTLIYSGSPFGWLSTYFHSSKHAPLSGAVWMTMIACQAVVDDRAINSAS